MKADGEDRENPCKDRENFVMKIMTKMTHHYHQKLIALSQIHPYSPNLNSLADDIVPFGLLYRLLV